MKKIPYNKQFIDYQDTRSVLKSLTKELITSGPLVRKFENKIKKFLNCKYSYACNSGTAAIHLAMLAAGLKKNDIILMPSINFISSYNLAKIMQLKVYLVDVDQYTGQVTPKKILECIKINKIKNIKAVITMYNGGYPENIKEFNEIKKKYNFLLIEDACHAFGSEYKYKNEYFKIGSCKHSDISTFSLHAIKSITTGEGGIVTTNNFKIAKNVELYRSHGVLRNNKKHWKYDVVKHGYNYRLSDINCALGLSQLKKINLFLNKRKKIFQKYIAEIKYFNKFLMLPEYSDNIKPAFHLFMVNIDFDKLKKKKDHFIIYLLKNKIIAQQHYIPIYKYTVYKESKTNFIGAEKFFKNSVSLPIYVNLSYSKLNKIIDIVKKYFKKYKKGF